MKTKYTCFYSESYAPLGCGCCHENASSLDMIKEVTDDEGKVTRTTILDGLYDYHYHNGDHQKIVAHFLEHAEPGSNVSIEISLYDDMFFEEIVK